MKLREINERPEWTFWVPDSVADWDAPSHWERERLASMQRHLHYGDVLFDVGTEHGWLTAVYGGFVGYENVVLFEPSPEFWPNIRLTWETNEFPRPLEVFQCFVGAITVPPVPAVRIEGWPPCAFGDEIGSMAYRYLHNDDSGEIGTVSIDWAANSVGAAPKAITIDVEGAELGVLRGAERTLVNDRPHVWVSIHPDLMLRDYGADSSVLHSYMAERGFISEHLATDHEEHWHFWPKEWGR